MGKCDLYFICRERHSSMTSQQSCSLLEFLQRARTVTDNYIEAYGEWTLDDQFAHTIEEIAEMLRAKNNLEELEEGWDIIFTILTRFHLRGYDNYAITESALSTLSKIEDRSKRRLREAKVCQ